MVFFLNNKIIIVWGRQTHPQLPADGGVTVKVTFPISFRYCQRFASTAAYDANAAAYIGLRYYGLSSITTYASNSNALWYYWIAVGY